MLRRSATTSANEPGSQDDRLLREFAKELGRRQGIESAPADASGEASVRLDRQRHIDERSKYPQHFEGCERADSTVEADHINPKATQVHSGLLWHDPGQRLAILVERHL